MVRLTIVSKCASRHHQFPRFQRRLSVARNVHPTNRAFVLRLFSRIFEHQDNDMLVAGRLLLATSILRRPLSSRPSEVTYCRLFAMRLTKHIPALIAMTKQLISSCYASHLSPIHTFSPNQPSHALVSSSQRRFQTAMDFINTFLSQGCVDPTSGKADITLCITSRARTVRSFLPLAVDVWECHTFNNHLHEVQIVGLIDAILSYTSSDSQRVPQRLSNCAWIALKNLLPSSSNVDYTTSSFVFKLVELIRRAFVSTPLPQSSSFSRYKNMRLMMHTMVFCYSAQLDRGYSNSGFRSCLDILMLCTRGRRQGMKNLLSLIDEGIGANQDDTLSPLDILLFEVVTQCTRLPFLRVALEVVSSSDYRSARVVDIARQCVLHTFIAKELVNPRCNTVSEPYLWTYDPADLMKVQGIVTSQQQVVMALRSMFVSILLLARVSTSRLGTTPSTLPSYSRCIHADDPRPLPPRFTQR